MKKYVFLLMIMSLICPVKALGGMSNILPGCSNQVMCCIS